MNKFILFLVIVGFASSLKVDSYSNLWSAWKAQYKRNYTAAEELIRYDIFVENYHKVNKLNTENDSARFALNNFADLTGPEFQIKYASGGFYEPHRKFIAANSISFPIEDLPDSVDWRTKDAVTPVKSQRDCNACYAFSVTGLLESFYFINNGQLLSFSEQQIMSCDFEGNQGCNGGFPSFALKYAVNNGLETDDDYPYLASDFSNCKYEKEKAFPVAGGYKFVTANSTDQLKAALVNSPVSVLVQADQDVFKFYESGVIKKYCDANVNFAALAVGYKKIGLVEAFIVKNQWGTEWGKEGYVHIATTQSPNDGQGVCGILSQPLIATN